MTQEAVNYIVVLPGNAHPIVGEVLTLGKAEAIAADNVAHGAPEAHVYRRVGVVKRTKIDMEWVAVKLPENMDEWLKSPEAREIV